MTRQARRLQVRRQQAHQPVAQPPQQRLISQLDGRHKVGAVDALNHQCQPFDNGVYEPMAGILHLAVWRARAKESDYDAQDLIGSFPDVVALALGIDIDMALEQDPIDWSSRSEVHALV